MKLSEINDGVPVPYDHDTDTLVAVRLVDEIYTDQLVELPNQVTAYGEVPEGAVFAAAGAGASIEVAGRSNGGIITLETGVGTAAGKLLSITYAETFPNGSSALLMPGNVAALALMPFLYTVPTDEGFDVMVSGDNAADDTTYLLNYLVVGF